MEDEQFFVGQKALIEKDGKVLVLRDPVEGLDYPGGKIQVGEENAKAALKREVREEVGLEIEVGKPFYTKRYIFPQSSRHPGKPVFLVAYRCRYVSGQVNLSHEHDKSEWVSKENYLQVDDGTTFFEMLQEYFA